MNFLKIFGFLNFFKISKFFRISWIIFNFLNFLKVFSIVWISWKNFFNLKFLDRFFFFFWKFLNLLNNFQLFEFLESFLFFFENLQFFEISFFFLKLVSFNCGANVFNSRRNLQSVIFADFSWSCFWWFIESALFSANYVVGNMFHVPFNAYSLWRWSGKFFTILSINNVVKNEKKSENFEEHEN